MSYLLEWDKIGERTYETGVDHGVLYPQVGGSYPEGFVWNGLTGVTESPSGAEPTALYADNMKYLSMTSAEEFGATVECYTYPPEWKKCDGRTEVAKGVSIGQQGRQTFGLSYRTKKGNDTEGEDYGYILHLVYGCSASTSERSYETVNDSPSAITFSYEITTTPVSVEGYKPTAILTIDSTEADAEKLKELESILYGTAAVTGETPADAVKARLPLPDEVKALFAAG